MSSRKALIVGINHYQHIQGLAGCVVDACSVKQLLDRNSDGSVNFPQPRMLLASGPGSAVDRSELRDGIRQLFDDDSEVALLYFAGHGYFESTGGYLCGSDCKTGDDGLPLSEIMSFANQSRARNKILILDSCHSGALGEHPLNRQVSEISEGVTILRDRLKMVVALGLG